MPVAESEQAATEPLLDDRTETTSAPKKKKKKKPKKAKSRDSPTNTDQPTSPSNPNSTKRAHQESKQSVLCISRNKHWKYISSYHGPWLQLPLELLESLLVLNVDPVTLSAADYRMPPLPTSSSKRREISPPPSPRGLHLTVPSASGRPTPPPIDPGVFKSVTTIRRLIDEASDLAVRAASGLSAVALGSIRSPGMGGGLGGNGSANSPWGTAQSLGLNPLSDQGIGIGGGVGRSVSMSAMRTHRLRTLAVQRLAAAYKADEIAASVMVMQGASALDDVAERVLKLEPNNPDALYVHFFHEKIPSRQLAESTTTQVLDDLIAAHPQRLEYLRTRGIVRCFRDEYQLATKDFTHALKEVRAARKARHVHDPAIEHRPKASKKKKGGASGKTNGQAPANGTSAYADDGDNPSGASAAASLADPLEPQLLFLRGAAYLQNVIFLIEEAVLRLEEVSKSPGDGAELRLCYIENGKYGGVEIGNLDGPLGSKEGKKLQAYRTLLGTPAFREQVATYLKKAMRDHEKFLSHFDGTDGPPPTFDGDLAQRTEYAFLLSEALRPGSHSHGPPISDMPPVMTTYHPLLIESHFSILICNLLLGDFSTLLPAFARAAALVDGLEGYPVFLPARSMAQAEFIEVLERLAGGWKTGTRPHSLSQRRLTIEPPPLAITEVDEVTPSTTTGSPHLSAVAGPSGTSSNVASSSHTPLNFSTDLPHASTSSSSSSSSRSRIGALAQSLDCARILLAPVIARQKERAERAAAEKTAGADKRKPLSINIPLHGPRVEIILAWLGAVHLPDMEGMFH